MPIFGSVVAIRVLEQTCRGCDFGENGEHLFIASNGYTFFSRRYKTIGCDFPVNGIDELYVLGTDMSHDSDIIIIKTETPMVIINGLNIAVKEYNHTFSDNNEIIEPMEGKQYKSRILI